MSHLKLLFYEKVRFRGSRTYLMPLWVYRPETIGTEVEARTLEGLLYQLAFTGRVGMYHPASFSDDKAWPYAIKRRGCFVVATWARRDRLHSNEFCIYHGTSLHEMIDNDHSRG